MPFKSQAQRRKFAELLVKGEISPETFEEWNRETGRAKLPERVTKGTQKRKSAKRSKSTKKAGKTRSTKNTKNTKKNRKNKKNKTR